MILKRHDCKHGGETGGADRHRLPGVDPPGERHQPFRLCARLLRVTAPSVLADPPTRQDDLVAGAEFAAVGHLNRAGKVNSRNMRIVPNQPAARAKAQPVLVVQGGILDRNGRVAFGKLILGHRLHRG